MFFLQLQQKDHWSFYAMKITKLRFWNKNGKINLMSTIWLFSLKKIDKIFSYDSIIDESKNTNERKWQSFRYVWFLL